MNSANETRRLVLMRHAKAEPAGSVSDEMRPLALNGRRQANAAGPLLVELGVTPDRVMVSGALRTRQTWELLSNGLDVEASFAEITDALYLAHPQDVLSMIGELDGSCSTALIVGHEPTMSGLAAHLGGPDSDLEAYNKVRFGLQTSAFAVLESTLPWSAWAEATARLTLSARPQV
ncbi:SixA phosphatase family protein [Populibacterium corticicola]|uniref:SixA phosphatase family protein n=1 Tax=Populibacterium corticicola TaxID=1812826 RepID=A0ABW5XEC3_9MICO